MRNNEIKNYKGYTITKVNGRKFMVGGSMRYYATYDDAKYEIDCWVAEDKALKGIDDYVRGTLGGYM